MDKDAYQTIEELLVCLKHYREFVKRVAAEKCCTCLSECISCEALKLLSILEDKPNEKV